jgi:hypothetical protein
VSTAVGLIWHDWRGARSEGALITDPANDEGVHSVNCAAEVAGSRRRAVSPTLAPLRYLHQIYGGRLEPGRSRYGLLRFGVTLMKKSRLVSPIRGTPSTRNWGSIDPTRRQRATLTPIVIPSSTCWYVPIVKAGDAWPSTAEPIAGWIPWASRVVATAWLMSWSRDSDDIPGTREPLKASAKGVGCKPLFVASLAEEIQIVPLGSERQAPLQPPLADGLGGVRRRNPATRFDFGLRLNARSQLSSKCLKPATAAPTSATAAHTLAKPTNYIPNN